MKYLVLWLGNINLTRTIVKGDKIYFLEWYSKAHLVFLVPTLLPERKMMNLFLPINAIGQLLVRVLPPNPVRNYEWSRPESLIFSDRNWMNTGTANNTHSLLPSRLDEDPPVPTSAGDFDSPAAACADLPPTSGGGIFFRRCIEHPRVRHPLSHLSFYTVLTFFFPV